MNNNAPTSTNVAEFCFPPTYGDWGSRLLRGASCICGVLGSKRIFYGTTTVLAFVSFLVLALQIPRGLGCSDEAWYMLLVREGLPGNGSAWTRVLGFMPDSVVAWRLLSLIIRVLSGALLCLGLLRFSGIQKKRIFWIFLSAAIILAADPSPVFAASYYNINELFFSLSFALAAFSCGKNKTRGLILPFFSGMALFFLGPVFPTNFPPCLVVVLAVICQNRNQNIHIGFKLIVFLLGLIAGAMLFFSSCMPLLEYLGMFRSVLAGSGGASSSHGFKNLLMWIEKSGIYVCFRIVLPAFVLHCGFMRRRDVFMGAPAFSIALVAFLFGSLLSVTRPVYDFVNGFEPQLPAEWPWIVAVFLVLLSSIWKRNGDLMFLLVVLLIPIALSFGTVVSLATRSRIYVWPFVVAAFIKAELTVSPGAFRKVRGGLLLLVVFSCVFSLRQHTGSWILLERNFFCPRTKDETSGLELSAQFAANVESCRKAGLGHSIVQPFSRTDWRYIYALGATPISFSFECERLNLAHVLEFSHTPNVFFIVPSKSSWNTVLEDAGNTSGDRVSRVLSFDDFDGRRVVYEVHRK